jgi:hypothetical protein cdivTM_09214
MFDFWQVQSSKLLFPEIAWNKPEQKAHAGKLLIIGGGAGAFRGLATSHQTALKTGVGEVRILLPDSLKKDIKINSSELIFTKSNLSGGFSNEAWEDFKAGEKWADSILFIGDTNKNSETAILFEKFILESEKPVFITRDAVDILLDSFSEILLKENISILASFAQLQKIFSKVFYPKVLTFSMNLSNIVEVLHKFTLSYPAQILTLNNENFIIAGNGEVFSSPLNSNLNLGKLSPIQIWSGEIPTKIAVWQIWNKSQKLKAAITAISS